MSDNKFRNGFGFGLLVGAVAVVLLVLGNQFGEAIVECLQFTDCSEFVAKFEKKPDSDLWWWAWDGKFVSSGDTLAQWLSVVLSAVAVLLLWRTLGQTNKTNEAAITAATAAIEANELMRQEQRPYVQFKIIELGDVQATNNPNGEKSLQFFPRVNIENIGRTPAWDFDFNVHIWRGEKFNTSAALLEMFNEKKNPTGDLSHILPSGREYLWENMGAGHRIRKAPTEGPGSCLRSSSKAHSGESLWFIAMVTYRYGLDWYYTAHVFTCDEFEIGEASSPVSLNLTRLHWLDAYC